MCIFLLTQSRQRMTEIIKYMLLSWTISNNKMIYFNIWTQSVTIWSRVIFAGNERRAVTNLALDRNATLHRHVVLHRNVALRRREIRILYAFGTRTANHSILWYALCISRSQYDCVKSPLVSAHTFVIRTIRAVFIQRGGCVLVAILLGVQLVVNSRVGIHFWKIFFNTENLVDLKLILIFDWY